LVRGFFGYHAVPTKGAALKAFRRRSQKDRFSWQRMHSLARLPEVAQAVWKGLRIGANLSATPVLRSLSANLHRIVLLTAPDVP
jgi:hypothetical protein